MRLARARTIYLIINIINKKRVRVRARGKQKKGLRPEE